MTSTPEPLPQLLDVAELADRLGVTERHVRRLVSERRVPFIKWGHLLRFDPNEIASWIDGNRVEVTPARSTAAAHADRADVGR